jgi:hypothetical protein
MAEIYRSVDSEGRVTYGGTPPTSAGKLDVLTPNGRRDITVDGKPPLTHDQIKDIIKAVQQVTPNLQDYLNFLAFVRRYDDRGFRRAMDKLWRESPDLYEKLRQHPQFRSLGQSAFNIRAAPKNLTFAAGAVGGAYVGSLEKWLATTVKDYMKEKRWGGYADDVLGTKASTLAAPKPPTYSNTRLGQFQKVDDPRAARAAKEAGKAWEDGRAAVRGAGTTAFTRVTKTGLDALIAAADADVAEDVGVTALSQRAQELNRLGVIDDLEWNEARQMLSQGKRIEMRRFLDTAVQRYLAR